MAVKPKNKIIYLSILYYYTIPYYNIYTHTHTHTHTHTIIKHISSRRAYNKVITK